MYFNSAFDSFEPSFELCIQYNFISSPTVTVEVDDQVVGAAGTTPKIIELASVQSEVPCEFTALTRTKYFSPLDKPVTVYLGAVILLMVVVAFDVPK